MSCVGDIGGRPQYKLKDIPPEDTVYPYEVSDHQGEYEIGYLVLGPGVVASKDGGLIIWRGVQYIRKDPIDAPDPLGRF